MNWLSKWLVKRRIRQSFQKHNSFGRDFILKTILEAMADTYTESNWSTRMGSFAEWLLENDKDFRNISKNVPDDSFLDVAKAVFSNSVERSYHRAKSK